MSVAGVNAFDLAVLAILLLSAILAWSRGFVREVLSLAAWIGAAAAAWYGFPYARPYARDLIPSEMLADLAAAASVFVVALFLLTLLGSRIAGAVGRSRHTALDRSLGFLFGIFRGALLVCLAYLVVSWAVPENEQPVWMTEARTMPLIRDGAGEIERLIPAEAGAQGRSLAERSERRARDAAEAERLYQRLNTPQPLAVEKPAAPPGYAEQPRRELDRLIRNVQ